MVGNGDGYDKQEVLTWIDQIETALNNNQSMEQLYQEPEFQDLTIEEEEIYESILRHYNYARREINEKGLSEEACYEVEVARELLDQLGYEAQLKNSPRTGESWEEFAEDHLED